MTDNNVFLNRYQADRLLGEGGMGKVYLGRQIDNGRPVVIKLMHDQFAQDRLFRRAFQQEMTLMMRFRHPYAVALYDASPEEAERPCIIMEYVPGASLTQIVERERKLAAPRFGRILGQLGQVLQAAHDNNIVHRDLSLDNVIIMNAGTGREAVKVMDFGLAQMSDSPHIRLERLKGDDRSIGGGTPDFVSPEQVRGEEVDYRADIYSLGVLMYKSLTGFFPFEKASEVSDILQAHVAATPPAFREFGVNGAVAPAVEELVHTCLAKYPRERPQSALEVVRRYEQATGLVLLPEAPIPATFLPAPQKVGRLDPRSIVDHFEAWMPEPIAVLKLRGFVEDLGGEFVDSEPGRVEFRLIDDSQLDDGQTSGLLALLGLGKKAASNFVRLELRLEKSPAKNNHLHISVIMVPEEHTRQVDDPEWKNWCDRLCRELRSYLISC